MGADPVTRRIGLGEFAWDWNEEQPEKPMPFNPFSPLVAKILAGVSGVLLIALVLTGLWGRAGWRDAGSWKTAYQNQKVAYTAAQKAAEAKAIAQKIRTENRYAELARAADAIDLSAARARAAAYAVRMRVKAPVGATSGTPAPAQGDPAQGGHGPGEATEFVAVGRNDFEQLVANSLRLEQVRRWGESLINEGLAMPEVEFGKPPSGP